MSTAYFSKPQLAPYVGIQITGFYSDPFQTDESSCLFLSMEMDSPPARLCSLEKMRDNLKRCGTDLLIYHVNPLDPLAAKACNRWAAEHGFRVIFNNELGQAHGPTTPGWRGWNWNLSFVKDVDAINPLFGLLHDELMHHHVHPRIPSTSAKTNPVPMIAPTEEMKSESAAYSAIMEGLNEMVAHTTNAGSRFLTEEVIPIFFHGIARAGGTPGCKILKEQNSVQSITLAMSAAWQYDTSWTGCIDLWEGDSGPWYQVMSKFSGHSPTEFQSALEMTYILNPECLYVESSDILWEADNVEGKLTEFGERMEAFNKEFRHVEKPLFDLTKWEPEIAIIHIEDGAWGVGPWPEYGLMGSKHLPIESRHLEWMKIWYHLMWGQADPQRLWEYQNPVEMEVRDNNLPGGHELDVAGRPDLSQRVDANRKESRIHRLFHPLNNAVVLDQHVEARHLLTAQLIFVTGSYAPETLWEIVEARVRDGATCLSQKDITPQKYDGFSGQKVGAGRWWTIEDFFSLDAVEAIMPFRGSPQQWRLKTSDGELRFFAKDPWGNEIGFIFEGK